MAESRTADYEEENRQNFASLYLIHPDGGDEATSDFSTDESSDAPMLTSPEPEGWPTLWRKKEMPPLLGDLV